MWECIHNLSIGLSMRSEENIEGFKDMDPLLFLKLIISIKPNLMNKNNKLMNKIFYKKII